MKIAVATKDNWSKVSGHAGQATDWLLYDCEPGEPLRPAKRIHLSKAQLPHHFQDDGPHPLHGIEIMVASSAGTGFVRHMQNWGAQVLLTGETNPVMALEKIMAGEALPDTRFDVTTTLCKLRDLFSRH
jgi:predicted Fe-Mo cluster-binding NifX family protein